MQFSSSLLALTTLLLASLTVNAAPSPGTYTSINSRSLLLTRQFGCDCGESSCSPSSPACCANGSCSCDCGESSCSPNSPPCCANGSC